MVQLPSMGFLKKRYLNVEQQQDKENICHHRLFSRRSNGMLRECHQ